MMQLGVSLNFIRHEGISEEVAQAVAASRIATLEVPAAFLADPAQREIIQHYLTVPIGPRIVSIHAPFGVSWDISSSDPSIVEAGLEGAREALRAAGRLGARILVIHASAEPVSCEERYTRIERARSSLAALAGPARAARCRIAVELLPRTCLGNSVEELKTLLADLDTSVFGVCLDTNHLMDRYTALPGVVRSLGQRLFTLHLSDYDGIDEKHWLPGRGVIDWHAFMVALGEIGYSGPFNFEADPEASDPTARITAFEANFAWLSGLGCQPPNGETEFQKTSTV